MDQRALNRIVQERAGLASTAEAARAVDATLAALRCALDDDDARGLASALPVRFSRSMSAPAPTAVHDADGLYREALRREGVRRGFAIEHAQAVLEALSRLLPTEQVERLRKHLPGDIASLLQERGIPEPELPTPVHLRPEHAMNERRTLSRGRPGTSDPIAEAEHGLAHEGSVARSSSGHAERMVETARSTRPGREDETLAAARRGGERKCVQRIGGGVTE
jgi:uncharacterized protein (DUF2267 family)